MSTFWGELMEQTIGALRNEKVSAFVMIVLCLSLWKGFLWAGEEHADLVNKVEFNELKTLLVDHAEDFQISSASNAISDKELEIRICKATNGTEEELARLNGELAKAQRYKACLVDRRPNCTHLRDSG